jgi:AcrR family transcriptional regulator
MSKAEQSGEDVAIARRGRGGRPAASRAGEVDARIMQAATTSFLERGFEATSFDQVALSAKAGKASLYARYPTKEALFAAVVRINVDRALAPAASIDMSLPLPERLRQVGHSIMIHWLAPMPIALMRIMIAAAPRMPDLVSEMDRVGWLVAMSRVSDAITGGQTIGHGSTNAVAAAAAEFIELVFVPHAMQAMLGFDVDHLRQDVPRRVDRAVRILQSTGALEGLK